MKNYKNKINCCLECLSPIEVKYPKEGEFIVCSHCGGIHIVELAYNLRNTGGFN